MTRASVQYALTIDGCPYAAATSACTTSISPGAEWPVGVTVVPGSLSRDTRLQWSESIKPITAETSVSGMSFILDDVIATSGDAAGERLWTYLFSRRQRYMDFAPLSLSISDIALSITVTRDPGFGSGSQVIWIDREAILCSGFNAGTLTFTASTRGYLGTRASAHEIDAANAYTPVVWGDWPGPTRRRVILWKVEGSIATPIWRGYCGRAPRLADNGAQWELQADHAVTTQMARALGPSTATARMSGFDPAAFSLTIGQLDNSGGGAIHRYQALREPYTGVFPQVLETALSIVERAMQDQLTAVGASFAGHATLSVVGDARPQADSRANRAHVMTFSTINLRPGSVTPPREEGSSFTQVASEIASNVFVARTPFPFRLTALVALRNGDLRTYPLDNTDSLPTSGLSASYSDSGISTRVQWAIQGSDPLGFAWHVPIESVDGTNKTFTGRMRRSSVDARFTRGAEITGDVLLTSPTIVSLVTVVESGHWLRAIQRGVLSTAYGVTEQADPRDWDFANAVEVIASTGGASTVSRCWVFDGTMSVGDFLRDTCRLDGCAVGLDASKLRIVALDAPLPTEPVTLAIDLTAGDGLHRRPPTFGQLADSIVNIVRVLPQDESKPSITVNNQSSVALYGQAPAVELEAKGALAVAIQDMSPFDLARGPLIRLLGLWGTPSEVITVDVAHAYLTSVELGDVVTVRSKIVPDGAGHRGIATTRRGRVFAREIDLVSATLRLQVLVFAADKIAGYAPAMRVDAISGADNKVVDAAGSYLLGTATDYAGSTDAAYTGTASDFGVSRFRVGDVVRFVRRDTTTDETEGGFVIDSVSPASSPPFVTLTPNPALGAYDWPSKVSAGEVIDLIADHYGSATTSQRDWAYVGSESTNELGGDPLKEWAP